jgi:hypothetical protein
MAFEDYGFARTAIWCAPLLQFDFCSSGSAGETIDAGEPAQHRRHPEAYRELIAR